MRELAGKGAFVTGAASGIGLAMATEDAASEAVVALIEGDGRISETRS